MQNASSSPALRQAASPFDLPLSRRNTGCVKYDAIPAISREELIPLWVADMDFAAPDCVRAALHQMADFGVFGYSLLPPGYTRAAADWFSRRFGWRPEEDWLVPCPGVIPGLGAALRALTRPGDGVLIQTPVYGHFFDAIRDNGRTAVLCPLALSSGRYEMDFPALETVISREKPRAFLLCSPHNPVGRVWTREELEHICRLCRKYDLLLISDEIHCDFVFPGSRHTPILALEEPLLPPTVLCTAPSKTFNLAALQCANLFVPRPELRSALTEELRKSGLAECNLAGLTACRAAYRDGDGWLDELVCYLRENAALAARALAPFREKISLIPSEGTYLLWLDCRGLGLSDGELKHFFRRRAGLWLSPGVDFGEAGSGFMRLNMACPRATLQEALDRLTRALREQ